MQPAVLLVNRAARLARADGWLARAESELGTHFSLDVRQPGDAAEMRSAAHAASAGGAIVLAAGGDGTLAIVADAVAESRGTMGILPLGTANDLARQLAIPADVVRAARLAGQGTERHTDLVSMNGRRFTTVGGLGLVSRSTSSVARMRAGRAAPIARLAGSAIYRLAASASLLERRITGGMRVRWRDLVTGGERVTELDTHGAFVTNHAGCGGGLVIPTGARGDDGVFEVALIPATSRARLLVHFSRLSAGLPLADDALRVIRTDHAVIETEHEDTFVADGELLETGRRFVLDMHPGVIGILR